MTRLWSRRVSSRTGIVSPPHEYPFDVPRFSYWTKEPQDDGGWLVTFRDLRYVDPGQPAQGIGMVQVRLDSALNPID